MTHFEFRPPLDGELEGPPLHPTGVKIIAAEGA